MPCVRVCGVEALVVLDVDEDAVPLGCFQEESVVFESFHGGLGDEDVDLSLDCIEGDRVVGCVGGKDRYGAPWRQRVNGGFVGV